MHGYLPIHTKIECVVAFISVADQRFISRKAKSRKVGDRSPTTLSLCPLQERNRIAREIHDALGHSLTAQSI